MKSQSFLSRLLGLTGASTSAGNSSSTGNSGAFSGAQATGFSGAKATGFNDQGDVVKILKKGSAMRVIFFYPGEEGTYVDNSNVTLYENGIVHIQSNQEETTTHLQNCEILWQFVDAEERSSTPKVRLLKPKGETSRAPSDDKNPGKGPELT